MAGNGVASEEDRMGVPLIAIASANDVQHPLFPGLHVAAHSKRHIAATNRANLQRVRVTQKR